MTDKAPPLRLLWLCLIMLSSCIYSGNGNNQPTILKVGLHANPFFSNGSLNPDGAQITAGFMMAVREINANKYILPNFHIAVAYRTGIGAYGAIMAAQALITANFTIDGHGNTISNSAFIRNNPIGVDVVVGAGDKVETQQLAQLLKLFEIALAHTTVRDLHMSVAGDNIGYDIEISPDISYDGTILQKLFCNYYGFRNIAAFTSSDANGLKSVEMLTDGTTCTFEILSQASFPIGTTNFAVAIAAARASGALVIALFMPVSMAASFLEQAYDSGALFEGTSVFGNSFVTDNSIWTYFSNKGNTADIMKGYIGLTYSPKFSLQYTRSGRSFVECFRDQTDTAVTQSDQSVLCSNLTDDTGVNMYRASNYGGVGAHACSGLNFSKFHENGSNMYSFTAHAYDAVYALADAVEGLLTVDHKDTINGGLIETFLVNNISFEGATGHVSFSDIAKKSISYSAAQRKTGITYLIYNFNGDLYQSTNGSIGLAVVGKWALESGGVTLCSADTASLIGNDCVSTVYYRTNNNAMPSDTKIGINISLSRNIKNFVLSAGCLVLSLVLTSLGLTIRYRHSKVMKAAQPNLMFLIHLGCIFGGLRVIVTREITSDFYCTVSFWFGHLAFGLTYSALLVKTWRIHRIINTKSMKRVKVTGQTAVNITLTIVTGLCLYLIIATVVGRPQMSYYTQELANQPIRTAMCTFQYVEFSTALYVMESCAMIYGLYLCYLTKNAPDAINDAYYIASGEFYSIQLFIFLAAFNLLFLLLFCIFCIFFFCIFWL